MTANTVKWMIVGLAAGIAAGLIMRPGAEKVASAVKGAAPVVKKDGEKLLSDVAKEAKKLGKELEAAVMPDKQK